MTTLPTWLILVIHTLAVARLTGLVVSDSITEPLRDRIIAWLDDTPGSAGQWVADLITCPWCAGMWISLVAAPLVWFWGDTPVMLIPALALAFSQVTGATANLGR